MLEYFKVRHVNSATTYRAQVFLNQSEAGLAKFEIWISKYRPRKPGQ